MENLNQSYLQELRKNNEGNNRANVSTSWKEQPDWSDLLNKKTREGGIARVGKRLYDEVPIETNGRAERESSSLVVYDMAIL